MSYITFETLKVRITAQRLENLCGTMNESACREISESIIARSCAIVDAFASAKYSVPLETVKIVEEWTLNLAEYELYKRSAGSKIPEKIRESYQNTIGQLADLAAGRIGLGVNGSSENIRRSPVMTISENENIFSANAMKDY